MGVKKNRPRVTFFRNFKKKKIQRGKMWLRNFPLMVLVPKTMNGVQILRWQVWPQNYVMAFTFCISCKIIKVVTYAFLPYTHLITKLVSSWKQNLEFQNFCIYFKIVSCFVYVTLFSYSSNKIYIKQILFYFPQFEKKLSDVINC